jgi:F-type H+-transporting ATPase subunit b
MNFNLFPLFAVEGGFGLNLNPLDTNLINLIIVIGVLFTFLRGFLGEMLERRRQAILANLSDAEQNLKNASVALDKAQLDLAEAQERAARILADGKTRAESIRVNSERRTIDAMAALKQDALADLSAEMVRISEELRLQTALQAIEKAMVTLPTKLDETAHSKLIDQSIANLEQA